MTVVLAQDSASVVTDPITLGDWTVAIAILLGSTLLGLTARRFTMRVLKRAGAEKTIARLIGRSVAMVVILVGLFYAISALGVRVGPVLGALGLGGIVIGLALQDILVNMVSGILLQVRRPIRRGEQVETNGYEGIVEDVNLRVVSLRSFSGDNVFIPNAMVLQNPITNWTRTPTRRTTLMVGVAYDTDLDRAKAVLMDATRHADGVRRNPEPEAWVHGFNDSSIDFAVRFWHAADNAEMWRSRDAVARSVKAAFDRNDITIPFPQRTLWFGPGNAELRVSDAEPGRGTGRGYGSPRP